MEETAFDQILRNEIPATRVYEDADVLAFLSIAPDAPGHTIVIPKKKCRNLLDMEESSFTPLMAATQKIARALITSLDAEGVNLIMNNEPAAGQVVFYAHLHLIPRHSGDGLHYGEEHHRYAENEAERVAAKIRAAL